MGKTRDVKDFRSGPPPDEWSSRFYHDKIIFDPKDDLVVSEGEKFDLSDSLGRKTGNFTSSNSSKCSEFKSILANGAIPYSADMEFFAFELDIIDMKDGAQLSFGVQDRSCELNKIIGTENHSLGIEFAKLLDFFEKSAKSDNRSRPKKWNSIT